MSRPFGRKYAQSKGFPRGLGKQCQDLHKLVRKDEWARAAEGLIKNNIIRECISIAVRHAGKLIAKPIDAKLFTNIYAAALTAPTIKIFWAQTLYTFFSMVSLFQPNRAELLNNQLSWTELNSTGLDWTEIWTAVNGGGAVKIQKSTANRHPRSSIVIIITVTIKHFRRSKCPNNGGA